MGTSKAAEMVTEACGHCGNAIEFSFNEWRHRATGSIYCKKVRGIRPTPEARPKLPSAPSPAGETAEEDDPYACSFTASGEHAPSAMGDCIYCSSKGRPHKMRTVVPEPVSTEGLPSTFGQMTGNLKVPPIVEALGPLTERDLLGFAAEPAAPIAPAAVSETEMKPQLKQFYELWSFQVDRTIERDKALAEKDARIAELTRERDHTWTQRNADLFAERNAAEAKLRAVSDALDERPGSIPMEGHYVCFEDAVSEYIDGLRAIVEGK